MVQRAKAPLQGWWSLPGGVVEPGELLDTAIRREVLEETGLVIEPVEVIEIFERLIRDHAGRAEYHYILIDYLCDVVGGNLCAADDAGRAEWIARDNLAKYQITEGTVPVIEKAFNRISAIHQRSDS